MSITMLETSPCGHLVPIRDGLKAYVPNPIPRHIDMSPHLISRLDEASRSVAMLAGVGETIPNPNLLIRPFMRREAVLSSSIEGTQASLSDLFLYEASGVRRGDVYEVINYVQAMEHGQSMLQNLPISLRLINEVHVRLLQGVRGRDKTPGTIRKERNWIGSEGTMIGDAKYVPPPADMVLDLLLDWEKFVNEALEMPPLVQCALMHYQFEAIHPYIDGNGRIGRLLIVLFLIAKQVLPTPLLYLSAYFERDRSQYYEQLFNLSVTGDWERWLIYFLNGVMEQSKDALKRVRQIRKLQDEYRNKLQGRRESGNTLRLAEELFASPVMTAPRAANILGVTHTGAMNILKRLVMAGVIEEIPGQWPHRFIAVELMQVIQASKSP